MKIITLVLAISLTVSQIKPTAHLHFLRKGIALAVAIGVVYKFDQKKAENFINLVHDVLETELGTSFFTKLVKTSKHNKNVKIPAGAARFAAGLLTFATLNVLLNHE